MGRGEVELKLTTHYGLGPSLTRGLGASHSALPNFAKCPVANDMGRCPIIPYLSNLGTSLAIQEKFMAGIRRLHSGLSFANSTSDPHCLGEV